MGNGEKLEKNDKFRNSSLAQKLRFKHRAHVGVLIEWIQVAHI